MTTPLTLDFPEGVISFDIPDLSGPQRLADVVRIIIPVVDALVTRGADIALQFGKPVSCKAGCGACCCQMVPLSTPEAVIISEVIDNLPVDRKAVVTNSFSAAHEKLTASGLLTRVYDLYTSQASTEEVQAVNRSYFQMNISCPFLCEGSCSIYPFRPSRCREYSVLSPAELCADPFDFRIKRLPITVKLVEALARAWGSLTQQTPIIVPMIDAPWWVESHAENRELMIEGAEQFIKSVLEYTCLSANKRAAQN